MKNVMNCPNCGAEVFNPKGCGVQKCKYCRSDVDFGNADVQQNTSNLNQNATADNNSADVQELWNKWIAKVRNAMIVHAVLIIFACIVSHFGAAVVSVLFLIADFVYSIVVASKLAVSIVRPNMTTTTFMKVITVIVFYVLFFMEFLLVFTAGSTILAFLK